MDVQDTVTVEDTTVRCDGGDGPLGHPAVYLHFDDKREIVCPYCSKRFVLAAGARAHGH
jgi:uncharacterized Zn-finger protein